MDGWIEVMNTGAVGVLLNQVWPMLWQSSLLIILVALANRTVFRKASPQLRYALWGLVLIRLVAPPWVDLPTGVGHWGGPAVARHAALQGPLAAAEPAATALLQRPMGPAVSAAPAVATSNAPAVPVDTPMRPTTPLSTASLLLALWAFGAGALALLLAVQVLRYHLLLRRGSPAPPAVAAMVADFRARLGVRWPVRVRIVAGNSSPALLGFGRPTILLPAGALASLDEDQLRAVLAHEVAHVKRWDFLVNWAQVLLGIVYFFHPLVWYANREMRREREQACDDMTLVALGLNRCGYAESLLRVAEGVSGVRRFSPVPVGVMETERELTRRLKRILDHKVRPAPRLTAVSVAVVLAFAALFGTWHYSVADPEAGSAPTTEEAVEMKTFAVKVVDEAGAPVQGADVTPLFLRTDAQPGSSYGWRPEFGNAAPAETDAAGIAAIRYPRYVMERMETSVAAVSVRHPDYASRNYVELNVDGSSPPIVVEAGVTLRVSGYLEQESKTVAPLYAKLSGTPESEWQPLDGGILERRDLAAGPHFLLLIHEASDGTLYFSDAIPFEARNGVVSEYKLPLRKGVRLAGTLDDSVPRPVKNGWAEVRICPEAQVGPGTHQPGSVEWTGIAAVRENGTFVIDGLPLGHAEVTAGCDGAVSKDEGRDGYQHIGMPTVTTLDAAHNEVEVAMVATATAVVRATGPSGEPVAGAEVHFWPNIMFFERYTTIIGRSPFSSLEGLQMTQDEMWAHWRERKAEYSAVTDETGTAVIKNLPPWAPDFMVTSDEFEMPINAQQRRQQSITLKPGETTEALVELFFKGSEFLGEATLTLVPAPEPAAANGVPAVQREPNAPDAFAQSTAPTTPATRFEGKVVDEHGRPLAGVRVDAWTWCPGNEADTGADGSFALADFDVDQRSIEVRFSKAGYSPVYMYRQPLGRLLEPIEMTTRTYLEGVVTDSAGKQVARALIRADAGPRSAEGVQITDAVTETRTEKDGRYRLPLQDDVYTITVSNGSEVATLTGVAVAKHEARRLDIALKPAPVFRATVIDSVTRAPVGGVRIGSWRRKEIEGTSDAAGEIEIAGMPEGPFEFGVYAEALGITRWWSEAATKQWEREYIEAGVSSEGERNWQRNFDGLTFNIAQDMAPVTIVTEQGARVRGTVLDPEDNPVAGATVAPAETGTGNSITGDTRFSVSTDAAGAFDMLLPASKIREYNLVAHDGGYQEWRNWANGVMEPITTQPGDVVEGVEIRLQPPCVIRGTVVDAQGNPVAGREVRAMSTAKDDNRYYVPTSRTGEDGRFEISFVAPGEHFVQVAPFWLDPEEQQPPESSQIVTVSVDAPAEGVALVAKSD